MKTLLHAVFLVMVLSAAVSAQITTAQSGNWSDASTWTGGVLPDSASNVLIAAGHTVNVNSMNAVCNAVAFGDTASHITLDTLSRLTVYGNFAMFSTAHKVFTSWAFGSVIRFAGGADQLISGLTTSTTAVSTSFAEIVVEKWAGKVYTPGTDIKFGFARKLEILSGTFELGTTDDIQGRQIDWTAAAPEILIHPDGIFTMAGSGSHIRVTNQLSDTVASRIGALTVYGVANLRTTSTNRINLGGIVVKEGGLLNCASFSASAPNIFNSGIVEVEAGSELRVGTTTNFWHGTSAVVLREFGNYRINVSSAATAFPPVFINNGTVQYGSSSDQTIRDMDYYRLEVSFSGIKTWTLGANRVITDSLETNNSTSLVITAASPFELKVGKTLRLTSGSIDNSSTNVTLKIAADGEISRATGTLTAAPVAEGNISYRYTSVNNVTSGPELLPLITNLTVIGTGGMVLGSNVTVTGALLLSAGEFDNNGSLDDKILTMADDSRIRRASGSMTARPVAAGNLNIEYISVVTQVTTGNELPADSSRIKDVLVTSTQGVILGQDLYVSGTLNITGSPLHTDVHRVVLGPDAVLIESPGNIVSGKIRTTRNVGTGIPNTFGGIGFEINAVGVAPGSTEVERVTGFAFMGNNAQSIERYYKVTPALNTGLNTSILMRYNDDELNNIQEHRLIALQSTDNGVTWAPFEGVLDTAANTYALSSLTSLALFTLCNRDSIIPVELTSFIAEAGTGSVTLRWTTATEKNNMGFSVERKVKGEEWQSIGFIRGAGTSTTIQHYSFIDRKVKSGIYSYRLKQTDFDGTTEYSSVVYADVTVPARFELAQNYPNPFNPSTRITFTVAEMSLTRVQVYNIAGEKVAQLFNSVAEPGTLYEVEFSAAGLSSGVYFVRMEAGKFVSVKKMILGK